MKKILRILLLLLTLLVLVISIFLGINYAPDKSFEELKEKWAYKNSQFLEIDGMQAHYRISGKGKPIVLIHGTGASLHTWEKWTTILEQDFQVISLDIPGFGLTGTNEEGIYTLAYYANFLDTFLQRINLTPVPLLAITWVGLLLGLTRRYSLKR